MRRSLTLWSAVVVLIAVSGGPGPRAPRGKPKPPPPLPELNRKVRDFAASNRGERVGSGECNVLAVEALRSAGARRFGYHPSGDYVWGRPVPTFREALPGDILQFRDAVFSGKNWLTPTRWMTWRQEYAHHTAVVAEVRDGGRELLLLHQNVGGSNADPESRKVVQESTLRPASLQKKGRVWIYRPVPPDDDAPAEPGPAVGERPTPAPPPPTGARP